MSLLKIIVVPAGGTASASEFPRPGTVILTRDRMHACTLTRDRPDMRRPTSGTTSIFKRDSDLLGTVLAYYTHVCGKTRFYDG